MRQIVRVGNRPLICARPQCSTTLGCAPDQPCCPLVLPSGRQRSWLEDYGNRFGCWAAPSAHQEVVTMTDRQARRATTHDLAATSPDRIRNVVLVGPSG